MFTLEEEFRFHDSSRFRKKAGDAKLPFYHSFVPVLMSLAAESCRSRAESVHLLKPYLHLFTMGKGLKEFQLCDSRRLRKKPQDAQDDVTELFDLFDAHFWGWKGIWNLDSQRRSSPVLYSDLKYDPPRRPREMRIINPRLGIMMLIRR